MRKRVPMTPEREGFIIGYLRAAHHAIEEAACMLEASGHEGGARRLYMRSADMLHDMQTICAEMTAFAHGWEGAEDA